MPPPPRHADAGFRYISPPRDIFFAAMPAEAAAADATFSFDALSLFRYFATIAVEIRRCRSSLMHDFARFRFSPLIAG